MANEFDSLVSIIIPTYNRSQFLVEAVESCLNQTYPHIEVIVIDDGSTDNTLDVLATFAERLPSERFRYARQTNRGAAVARNAGLRMARGTYIKFLDDDDTIEHDAIEHYVRVMQETGADLCIGSKRYMSPEGKKWSIAYRAPEGLIDHALRRFFDLEIRPQQGIWCFHRRVFEKGVIWDESLQAREDTDLLARLLVCGATVTGAPQAILNQRYHTRERVSGRQFDVDIFRQIHASNRRLLDLMIENGLLREAGRSFARSMCRTALRMWEHDREAAWACYHLARKSYWWPELVLLDHYPRSVRILAYALWMLGGLRLCGPLMERRSRWKQRKEDRRRRSRPQTTTASCT